MLDLAPILGPITSLIHFRLRDFGCDSVSVTKNTSRPLFNPLAGQRKRGNGNRFGLGADDDTRAFEDRGRGDVQVALQWARAN